MLALHDDGEYAKGLPIFEWAKVSVVNRVMMMVKAVIEIRKLAMGVWMG